MEQFTVVLDQLIGFAIMLVIGYICVRCRIYGEKALDGIRESDSYLFGEGEPFQNPVGSTGGKPPQNINKKLEDMTYEEYVAYRQGEGKKD